MSEFGLGIAPYMIICPANQPQHSREKRWNSTLQAQGTSFSDVVALSSQGSSGTCFDVDETVHIVRQL